MADPPLIELLDRPQQQRAKEYQYRCAQALVFGLPVIALQWLGPMLDRVAYERWVALLQALLAGWVCYVGAAGMLFESLLMLARRRVTADLIPSAIAIGCYLWTLPIAISQLSLGRAIYRPMLFDVCVMVLIVWTALRWFQLSRLRRRAFPHST